MMQHFHQFLFVASLVGLSWLGMMTTHGLGHVVGAISTGGSIERVVLYPLRISRTDVSPNPHPAIVVWLGPIVGCILPLLLAVSTPRRMIVTHHVARFFAGFCLIANGAYIALGSLDRIGDCGEMLRTGTPQWAMLTFGTITISLGLYFWHQLGSLNRFTYDPSVVTRRMAYGAFFGLLVAVVAGLTLSSQ
jgi:hypothetical protein